jgi:hypothetical protein
MCCEQFCLPVCEPGTVPTGCTHMWRDQNVRLSSDSCFPNLKFKLGVYIVCDFDRGGRKFINELHNFTCYLILITMIKLSRMRRAGM